MQQLLQKLLPEPLPKTTAGLVRALREILQSLALLGLWRARFFEHSAFYGGTALRILYGLDRFSEDLDFSLLLPSASFDFQVYASALERELNAFGFEVTFETKKRSVESTIESAFLKGNTWHQLIMIEAPAEILKEISKEAIVKIKLEIDIHPPGGFDTEMKYIFSPVQYAVRSYTLPSLFAGKIHALLCRRWKNRVKGRDWYDFIWYASRYPLLNLHHLEERMRQSGHYQAPGLLTRHDLMERIFSAINELNLNAARQEVAPFVNNVRSLDLWSKDFFKAAAERIVIEGQM
jgi:predicted nucleotidyltransferase component of viral defense system